MKPLLISLFSLFLFISCDSFESKSKISFYGPILETVNENGALEYIGRVVNNSSKEVKRVKLKYIVKDNKDNIVEATTYDISTRKGDYLSPREIVDFKFSIRSKSVNAFNKEFVLKHN